MSGMRLPKEAVPAFMALAGLNEEGWKELETFLSEVPPLSAVEQIMELAEKVNLFKHIAKSTVHQLVVLVVSLRLVIEETGRPLRTVLRSVIGALKVHAETGALTPERESVLISRLEVLLNPKGALSIATHAKALIRDNARQFTGVRVISDVRPVFGHSVAEAPIAYAVVHSLKISYTENHEDKDFFVNLSSNDLELLEVTVKRAKDKLASICKATDATGMKPFVFSEDE